MTSLSGCLQHRLVVVHVVLAGLLVGMIAISTIGLRRSRAAIERATDASAIALDTHRAAADTRALLAASWRHVLSGSESDRARAEDLEVSLARSRAPLEARVASTEVLEALDASASASAWARSERPLHAKSSTELAGELSRIAAELDGAAWRLDAALERHLDRRAGIDPAFDTWSERAVYAVFAAAILAWIVASIVIVREVRRNERRRSEVDDRDDQLRKQREELVQASREVHRSLQSIATSAETEPVRETARRLDDQLEHLFDVTRIDHGDASLRREYCDSRTLVEKALQHHRAPAARRAIQLRAEASIAGLVLADRERIGHVLETLIGTALQPAPPGGEIVVMTTPDDNAVRFAVCNVTAPSSAHALEMRDVPGSRQLRREPLQALELYTCKRLVEAHGGSLGVDRANERAHTYWFTLPNEPRVLR